MPGAFFYAFYPLHKTFAPKICLLLKTHQHEICRMEQFK
jgi:hypothetical protein